MILFTILVAMLLAFLVIGIVTLSIGGVALFAVYGDAIIFGILMVLIVRALVKHFKKKD